MEQQRIAVGRGLGDLVGADRAAGAADILDHHALAEPFAQALGEQPRQHVGGGAGRERHHDADGAGREYVALRSPADAAAQQP